MLRAVALAVAAGLVAAACGDDGKPEPTIEERLAAVEGRQLSPTEVSRQLDLAGALCRLGDEVLDALWFRLDDDQLGFQDVVFGYICPERAVLYAGHTGRYVTEDAESSGVSTSTTRPAAGAAPSADPATTAGGGTTASTAGSSAATSDTSAPPGPDTDTGDRGSRAQRRPATAAPRPPPVRAGRPDDGDHALALDLARSRHVVDRRLHGAHRRGRLTGRADVSRGTVRPPR